MSIREFNIINLGTLNNFFNGKSVGENLIFKNMPCVQCGKSVNVEIQKTATGYGFLNGIISEPSGGELLALCSNCNDKWMISNY